MQGDLEAIALRRGSGNAALNAIYRIARGERADAPAMDHRTVRRGNAMDAIFRIARGEPPSDTFDGQTIEGEWQREPGPGLGPLLGSLNHGR